MVLESNGYGVRGVTYLPIHWHLLSGAHTDHVTHEEVLDQHLNVRE